MKKKILKIIFTVILVISIIEALLALASSGLQSEPNPEANLAFFVFLIIAGTCTFVLREINKLGQSR